jgi:dienelactone hydrolase
MALESEVKGLIRNIEFVSEGICIRGWLRLPHGDGPHPLIVLAHGFGGLKEWTIPEVADSLVSRGFAALAFDYRNFGDSEGLPRDEVDSPAQISNWRSAIDFATTLPEIDPTRIGLWGTSLGGMNVLIVAALDHRVRCVVAQAPAIDWGNTILQNNNSQGRARLLSRLAEDRKARILGNEPVYVDTSEIDPEFAEYVASLSDEAKVNWNKRLTLRSFEASVASNALPFMHLISPKPLLMILMRDDVVTPLQGQLEAYAAAREPKELHILKGRHYDVYMDLFPEVTALATKWFERTL